MNKLDTEMKKMMNTVKTNGNGLDTLQKKFKDIVSN